MFKSTITKPLPLGPSLPYLDGTQLRHFEARLKQGDVSIFERGECKNCKRSIPKSMECCSKACYEVEQASSKIKRKAKK